MAELGWDGSGRQGGPAVEVGSTWHTSQRLTSSMIEARSDEVVVRGLCYAYGISGWLELLDPACPFQAGSKCFQPSLSRGMMPVPV